MSDAAFSAIRSITGTPGEIIVTDGNTPTISIDPSYDPITGVVDAAHGGTGVNNGAHTLTFGANINLGTSAFNVSNLTPNSVMIVDSDGTSMKSVSINSAFTVLMGQPLNATPTAVTLQSGNGVTFGTSVPGVMTINATGFTSPDLSITIDNSSPPTVKLKLSPSSVYNLILTRSPCGLLSTTALNATYTAGTGGGGVGATLTMNVNGALQIDGKTPIVGERIIVNGQASSYQNGIYVTTTVGNAGTPGLLTRADDATGGLTATVPSGLIYGSLFLVYDGVNYAGATVWLKTDVGGDIHNTNTISFIFQSPQTLGPSKFWYGDTLTQTPVAYTFTQGPGMLINEDTTNKTLNVGPNFTYLPMRTSCRVATTSGLAGTYYNGPFGDGRGATLTAASNTPLPAIDGVNVSIGDRILVKNQTGGGLVQNGIFTATDLGSVSTPWIVTRATDFDSSIPNSVLPGVSVSILDGSTNLGGIFVLTGNNFPIILGTTNIVWTRS